MRVLVALVAAMLCGAAFAEVGPIAPAEAEPVKGRILVEADDDAQVAEHGRVVRQIGRWRVIELPEQANDRAVLQQLRKQGKNATQDVRRPPQMTTDDPNLGSSWHLNTIGAPAAWDRSSGAGVVMAVCDTGVNPHPDLDLVPGWNTFDNNANSADVYGHGTKVAGSVAMLGNNGIGGAGVAYRTKIMPIRISDANGWGYDSMIATCIRWAADHGARGANVSYGVCDAPIVIDAAKYMRSKGGVVTVSAGNGGNLTTSANTPELTCVSATDSGDNKTSWSTYGPMIDVAAPGDNIYTTTREGGYAGASGTSFAAPVTLGVYALMIAANPKLTPAELDDALFRTAKDLGAAGRDDLYGRGRVDAAAAVAAVSGTTNPAPRAPVNLRITN